MHITWDRSPAVPHRHVLYHNIGRSGVYWLRVFLRRSEGRRGVASPLWAGGAAVSLVCRLCGLGAVWWSVLHGSGGDDPHVIGEGGALVVACC